MQVLADVRRQFHQPDKDEEQSEQDREAFEHYRAHPLGVCGAGRGHGRLLGSGGRHGCHGLAALITVGLFFYAREFSENPVSLIPLATRRPPI